jgi:hemoglobin-like flavoprotein
VLNRTARNPAQIGLFLLEPAADAAMTYFYGQLFAIDPEIRAMFPPAMDVQRRRFFAALVRIAADQDEPAVLVPYLEHLGRAHRKYGSASSTTERSAGRCWPRCTGSPGRGGTTPPSTPGNAPSITPWRS